MDSVKGIQIEDLYELTSVSDPRVSTDGKEAIYVETTISKEKNDYISNIFHLDIDTGERQQWTFGEYRATSPRWSPDGSKLLFLSNRTGKSQIYVMNRNGGEAKKITDLPYGVSNPIWSPCGSKVAFTSMLEKDEDFATPKEVSEEIKPLVVEKMKYKSDELGFLDNRYKQIFIVDLYTNEVEKVTNTEMNYELQAWSPDGSKLTYTGDDSDDLDFSFQSDVFLLDVKSTKIEKLTNGVGFFAKVTWSPNGEYLALIGNEQEYKNATQGKIYLYHFATKSLHCLTEEMDLPIGDYTNVDYLQGVTDRGVVWSKDHYSFYFLASDQGNTVLYYGNTDGAMYPALLSEEQHIYGFDLHSESQEVLLSLSTSTKPGELYHLHVPTGELKQKTDVNKRFIDSRSLSSPESFQFDGREGMTVHGWMMKPIGFQEGEKYPLVVEIHGGPHTMYGNTFFHEFQALAANGYAVLYINPRGSHGYGQQFVNAVRGDYGGNDYHDIMDAVDYAIQHFSFVDETRLGVTGGSYGGFMTNWIVAHTDRFKAAVTQRSISNWISFYGVSDIGYYFSEWQMLADLHDVDTLWKHSPIAYVDNVTTPLLILHSEKDYRCPIEQAEQLYIALSRQKKKTKFIRFPESNHNLSRSGKPSLRIARLESIVTWFNDHLE